MITHRQRQLLMFIERHLSERGVAPSTDEMRLELGLASKSGVWAMLERLEQRGYIHRTAYRHRAIAVMRSADGSATSEDRYRAALEEIAAMAPRDAVTAPRIARLALGEPPGVAVSCPLPAGRAPP